MLNVALYYVVIEVVILTSLSRKAKPAPDGEIACGGSCSDRP
jgi:hypothetical protein